MNSSTFQGCDEDTVFSGIEFEAVSIGTFRHLNAVIRRIMIRKWLTADSRGMITRAMKEQAYAIEEDRLQSPVSVAVIHHHRQAGHIRR